MATRYTRAVPCPPLPAAAAAAALPPRTAVSVPSLCTPDAGRRTRAAPHDAARRGPCILCLVASRLEHVLLLNARWHCAGHTPTSHNPHSALRIAHSALQIAATCICICIICTPCLRQDSMATPGNFGGGSTGPGQGFLGITRAPPSAPGRGRAQSPVRRNPNPRPQSTRQPRERLAVEVLSYSSKQ
jgi:hypothetical protein